MKLLSGHSNFIFGFDESKIHLESYERKHVEQLDHIKSKHFAMNFYKLNAQSRLETKKQRP